MGLEKFERDYWNTRYILSVYNCLSDERIGCGGVVESAVLSLEEQAEIQSDVIRMAHAIIRGLQPRVGESDKARDEARSWVNTIDMAQKALTEIQRALHMVSRRGRRLRTVTELTGAVTPEK